MNNADDIIPMEEFSPFESESTSDMEIHTLTVDNQKIALLETRNCLLSTVEIAAKKEKDLLAALPYAMEEQLAEQVEDLHFVSTPVADESQAVVVISHSKMSSYKNALDSSIPFLLPDVLLIPIELDEWSIAILGPRVLIRTSFYSGYEISISHLEQTLTLFNHENDCPDKVSLYIAEGESVPSLLEPFDQQLDVHHYSGRFYDWLEQYAKPATELNLLSNIYSVRSNESSGLKPWLPTIVILTISLLLYIGLGWKRINDIESQINDLNNKTEMLFKQAFPEAKRLVNPRVQAEQKIRDLYEQVVITNSDFFPLFNEVMQTVNRSKELNVNGFSWKNSTFQLQLVSNTVTQVDQLKSDLERTGHAVEIINAVNRDGKYQAQLKIWENLE